MVRITQEHLLEEAALTEITRREVGLYAAISDVSTFYPILDDESHTYAVVIISDNRLKWSSNVFVMAQVVGQTIVVLEDTDDKPLVEALLASGIPREQIILAYKGETLPDTHATE